MACPVCDHTMQNLGVPGTRKFWCPRCGTLKDEILEGSLVEPTIWVRHIEAEARFSRPQPGVSQHSLIQAVFRVDQTGSDAPTVKLERFVK